MSKSSFTYHVSPLHCPLTCYLSERLTVHLPIHGMSNSPLTCTTPTLNESFPTIVGPKQRANTGWLGIRLMCSSGATCLPEDCCFSEITLKIQQIMLVQYKARHQIDSIIISWNVTCSVVIQLKPDIKETALSSHGM